MNKSKRDKKKYYSKNFTINNKRKEELSETMTGVLITTDKNKEKNAVRDAYNILNDMVEKLYPGLSSKVKEIEVKKTKAHNEAEIVEMAEKKQKISEDSSIVKKVNVTDALEDELKNLRNNKAKMFFNFETNCKGVVFIKVEKNYRNDIDIKDVVLNIINQIKETKDQVSRSISRFIPAEIAMKARMEIFTEQAPKVLDKYFKTDDEKRRSWKLEFKSRNNNSIKKDEYLEFLLQYISRDKFCVDYKNPDYTILIEITNDLLILAVLEKYTENKCYNLLTLSKNEEELKMEREKLMNKQRERELEKLNENKKTQEEVKVEIEKVEEIVNEEIAEDDEESDINII
jgi:tRNA acetyltransferase TAN1